MKLTIIEALAVEIVNAFGERKLSIEEGNQVLRLAGKEFNERHQCKNEIGVDENVEI